MAEISDSWRGAALVIGIPAEDYARHRRRGLLWCSDCRSWKEPEEFALHRTRTRGRAHKCRKCQSERWARYWAKNGAKVNAKRRAQQAGKRPNA